LVTLRTGEITTEQPVRHQPSTRGIPRARGADEYEEAARVTTLWVTPERTPTRPDVDLAVLRSRLRTSTGREGTLWPVAACLVVATAVTVVLVLTEPLLAVAALLWTSGTVATWVVAIRRERPAGSRPPFGVADYRSGTTAGDVLASTSADQLRTSLALLRKAHTPEIGRAAVLATSPAVAAPWPVHLHGRSWHEVPPPPERHACWPQTVGVFATSGLPFERCACGAQRIQRLFAPWEHRNERVAFTPVRPAPRASAAPVAVRARRRHRRPVPKILALPLPASAAGSFLALAGRAATSRGPRMAMSAATLSVPFVLLLAGTTADSLHLPFLPHGIGTGDRPTATSVSAAPAQSAAESVADARPVEASSASAPASAGSATTRGVLGSTSTAAGATAGDAAQASAGSDGSDGSASARDAGARRASSAGSSSVRSSSSVGRPVSSVRSTTEPAAAAGSSSSTAGPVRSAVSSVVAPVSSAAGPVRSAVSSVAAPVTSAVSSVAHPVVAPVKTAVSSSVAAPVTSAVAAAVSSVARPVVAPVQTTVSSVAAPVVTKASTVVAPVVTKAGSVVGSVAGPLVGAASSAVAPVVKKAAPVVEKAAPVVEKAAPVVEKAAPVVDKAAPVADKAAPVVDKAAEAVGSVASALGGGRRHS
jgi:hypothetical protein